MNAIPLMSLIFHYNRMLNDLNLASPDILAEDAKLNFTGLAAKYGYPAEEHTVLTSDGYLLKMFRLSGADCSKRNPPVLMMHGLLDSADTWLMAGPGVALGYALADACRDVWCASHRGDHYGRAHATLDPDTDARFWDFDFDELGEIDSAAAVDYVLGRTGSDDLIYVGHSQGTSDFFIMASSKPEYNSKVRLAVLLSPIAWLTHMNSAYLRLGAALTPLLRATADINGEVLGRKQLAHLVGQWLCSVAPDTLCYIPIEAVAGARPGSIARRTLRTVAGHYLSGTSAKNVYHYAQSVNSGRFARYDYGPEENSKRYGSRLPPEYDLSKVTAPVVLVAGRGDRLSVIADVDRINATLPNVVDYYIVPDPHWGHGDPVWGELIPKYLTPRLITYLNNYSDD